MTDQKQAEGVRIQLLAACMMKIATRTLAIKPIFLSAPQGLKDLHNCFFIVECTIYINVDTLSSTRRDITLVRFVNFR